MQEKIKEALNGLKDFQLSTVEYAYDQLYVKNRKKILIADEVGLGKTIVAKGIIAKGFKKYLEDGGPSKKNPTYNVVYICSNMAIASQNINKLNFLHDNKYVDKTINRLIYLAYKPKTDPPVFLINALTPGTSFEEKSHQGEVNERAIIFSLMANFSPFYNRWNGLKWLLKGGVQNISSWDEKIRYLYKNRHQDIRDGLFQLYRKELINFQVQNDSMPKLFAYLGNPRDINLWHALMKVCKEINHHNYHQFNIQGEIIRYLRRILSKICLQYLGADIFILDEFQRYNDLIKINVDAKTPAIEVARTVFSIAEAKVLMLSATPFKPYTNDFDELHGEVHYNEFITVLKFLMSEQEPEYWDQFEQDRRSFFRFLRHPTELKQNSQVAIDLKKKLEKLYRKVIVRTEKLLASDDKDALIKRALEKPVEVWPDDIRDFIILDKLTQHINKEHNKSLSVPLEYSKSCPFALSFLDNYAHKEQLKKLILKDEQLLKLLKKSKPGWLNLSDINQYKPLIPLKGHELPNAKYRLLLKETVLNNGWKYLWIPPSLSYYRFEGAYTNSGEFSKTLVFSSWKMVPRMISSMISYEAERLSIGNPKSISEKEAIKDKRQYFSQPRTPRPQFTFKVDKHEQDPQQMNNFILTYPSTYLAQLYDPASNIVDNKSIAHIIREIAKQIKAEFIRLNLNQYVSGQGDWQKWYWLAPLLLDKSSSDSELFHKWFLKGIPSSELSIDTESSNIDKDENSGKGRHFIYASETFLSSSEINAGYLNDKNLDAVCNHLAELVIGSPSVCFLRSIIRICELSIEHLDASFNVSSAFLSMFNKPESIAVIRLTTPDNDYWQRTLRYSIDGNIQSMIDEYIYLLISGENITHIQELSNHIIDILSVRTVTNDIDDLQIFIDRVIKHKRTKKSIRSHYAVNFGNQKKNTASGVGRQINIRQAFNSPFRPFVLATTSVGQEGLDFHLYCRKIFHWNLPSNPIDFEQREGRIYRYQGHVVRLNIARKYRNEIQLQNEKELIWEELFRIASKEKANAKFPCDIVPYWHTESTNDIKIERFVPLYPYSRDIEKYNNMIKVLTFYRLTFGQPRQEELVEALSNEGFNKEEIDNLEELIINLSPIIFNEKE